MSRAACRRRAGFTLIEVLVVMAVMALYVAVGSVLIFGVLRTYEADAAAQRRSTARRILADQFRADVAAAEAAPDRDGDDTAGPRRLLLRQPGGRLVAYRRTAAGLERLATRGDDVERLVLALGGEPVEVEFRRGGPDGRLVTLRLTETRGTEGAEVHFTHDLTAALAGDLR